MKKIMIRVLLLLLVLVVGYLAFNQIDARPDAPALAAPPALAPEVFEKSNGFYRLWTLTEPKDVDIETDAAILPYRRLFDPAFDNNLHIKEFKKNKKSIKFQKSWGKHSKAMAVGRDWLSGLIKYQEQLRKASEEYGFMLARYEKLIHCESFIDFSLVRTDYSHSQPAGLAPSGQALHCPGYHGGAKRQLSGGRRPPAAAICTLPEKSYPTAAR